MLHDIWMAVGDALSETWFVLGALLVALAITRIGALFDNNFLARYF